MAFATYDPGGVKIGGGRRVCLCGGIKGVDGRRQLRVRRWEGGGYFCVWKSRRLGVLFVCRGRPGEEEWNGKGAQKHVLWRKAPGYIQVMTFDGL